MRSWAGSYLLSRYADLNSVLGYKLSPTKIICSAAEAKSHAVQSSFFVLRVQCTALPPCECPFLSTCPQALGTSELDIKFVASSWRRLWTESRAGRTSTSRFFVPAKRRTGESGDPHKRETSSLTSVLSQHRPFVLYCSGTFLVLRMINRLSSSLSDVRGLTTQRALFWLQVVEDNL